MTTVMTTYVDAVWFPFTGYKNTNKKQIKQQWIPLFTLNVRLRYITLVIVRKNNIHFRKKKKKKKNLASS